VCVCAWDQSAWTEREVKAVSRIGCAVIVVIAKCGIDTLAQGRHRSVIVHTQTATHLVLIAPTRPNPTQPNPITRHKHPQATLSGGTAAWAAPPVGSQPGCGAPRPSPSTAPAPMAMATVMAAPAAAPSRGGCGGGLPPLPLPHSQCGRRRRL
jgi:hypothetical protein